MSRFFHLILTKLTVAAVVAPDVLITLGNYFIYDLGDESYFLSAPMMCVSKQNELDFLNWEAICYYSHLFYMSHFF